MQPHCAFKLYHLYRRLKTLFFFFFWMYGFVVGIWHRLSLLTKKECREVSSTFIKQECREVQLWSWYLVQIFLLAKQLVFQRSSPNRATISGIYKPVCDHWSCDCMGVTISVIKTIISFRFVIPWIFTFKYKHCRRHENVLDNL